MAGNALTNGLYLIVMTFAWKFAKIGGLNQGIISTLLSFSSVINIFSFAFFFNEKITKLQISGIFVMICSVACMSIKLDS
jgi:drug/metabolite transporter (DMT)-like permease